MSQCETRSYVNREIFSVSLLPPALQLALVVLPEDVENQPKPADSSDEEADYRQPGISEKLEGGLYSHQQRSSDNQRRQNEARGDPICHLLGALDYEFRFSGLNLYVQFSISDGIEYFVEPGRQRTHKLLGFE
jgi:hypothetical protein